MSHTYFKFKQFTVHHDICAMKVGTDGVLLGAWANVDGANKVLDVGTGTGILALMVAQRNPTAEILAIDINDKAVEQAIENIHNSPYSNRIKAEHISFQQLVSSDKIMYDHIITNPPYFIDSLHSPNKSRTIARHSTDFTLSEFLRNTRQMISENGKLSMILPFDQKADALSEAEGNDWFVCRSTVVFPKPDSKPKRVLLEFTTKEQMLIETELTIELARHEYSENYITLTKDFYIKM